MVLEIDLVDKVSRSGFRYCRVLEPSEGGQV